MTHERQLTSGERQLFGGGGGGGGGGTDYSSLSTTTLEFLAAGGDQAAQVELDNRRGGGEASVQDLGNGLVLVTHPDGSTEVRSVSTGGSGSAPSFSSSRAAQELAGQQAEDQIRLQSKLALEADLANDQRRLKQIEFAEGLAFDRERKLLSM